MLAGIDVGKLNLDVSMDGDKVVGFSNTAEGIDALAMTLHETGVIPARAYRPISRSAIASSTNRLISRFTGRKVSRMTSGRHQISWSVYCETPMMFSAVRRACGKFRKAATWSTRAE